MKIMSNFVLSILIIAAIAARGEFSDTHDDEIDQLLKKLNKPALKSIKSPDGDIIDCVHLKNHPIYDNPLFKNHTIQLRPSFYPKGCNNESSNTNNENIIIQLWTKNGKCPKNSIPIRRTRREDILRTGSIEKYMKKYPKNISGPNPVDLNGNNYQHEYARVRVDGIFHGVKASINVWKPYVQTPKEFSLAQIWFAAGPYAESNVIEFGWQVYEARYGDNKPRVFAYWTADGYHDSGCYNIECSGFVAVHQNFALGGAIEPLSIIDGEQYQIPTTIWKDANTGHYWLRVNDYINVGYWPSKLFNYLQNHATRIKWGGEITNFKYNSKHTTTNMGSGHFAEEGYRKASYFKNLETCGVADDWLPIHGSSIYMTSKSCYSAGFGSGLGSGSYFFYGGPGRNQNCN